MTPLASPRAQREYAEEGRKDEREDKSAAGRAAGFSPSAERSLLQGVVGRARDDSDAGDHQATNEPTYRGSGRGVSCVARGFMTSDSASRSTKSRSQNTGIFAAVSPSPLQSPLLILFRH